MAPAIDLTPSSHEQGMYNDHEPREDPCTYAVASLSNPASSSSLAETDPRQLFTSSSDEHNAETTPLYPRSKTETYHDSTRRQPRQRLPRLCKDESKEASPGLTRRPRKRERILPKQCRVQIKREKERTKIQLDSAGKAERVEIPRLRVKDQDHGSMNRALLNSSHERGVDDQSTLTLDHAEAPRLLKDKNRRTSSPDEIEDDLPLAFKPPVTLPACFLPTPPDSDIGSDPVESTSDRIPSYRFVSVPRCPLENTNYSTMKSPRLQGSLISKCSSSEHGTKTPGKSFQKRKAVSFSRAATPKLQSIEGTTPPAKKPLLNLVWQDMGNGISRAYPRQVLSPPPVYIETPVTLATLTEGLDYFFVSDTETDTSQHLFEKDTAIENTLGSNDWLCFDNDGLQVLPTPPSTRREPIDIFSPDSETATPDTDLTLGLKARFLPSHTFVATPESAIDCPKPDSDPADAPILPDSIYHNEANTEDSIPSNIQPIHLTPHRTLSSTGHPSQLTEIEQYNPTTNSGFSDSETDMKRCKNPHPRRPDTSMTVLSKHEDGYEHGRERRRSHRRRRQWRLKRETAAKVEFEKSQSYTFMRIGVLRAAERLVKLVDRKKV